MALANARVCLAIKAKANAGQRLTSVNGNKPFGRRQNSHPRLRLGQLKASDSPEIDLASLPDPDDARGAIALGLKLTEAGQWEAAQGYFERALELPGTGVKRFRDKPKLLSDGEKQAIMYNIACCQAQLGGEENIQNGLMALASCLEVGK